MRTAPRGSIPWAQGVAAYFEGTTGAAGLEDLLATIALLHSVDPEPEAMGKMALVFLAGVCILDAFGRLADGTALEARFSAVVRSTTEPMTLFWWNLTFSVRAAYAHEDPSRALRHSDAIQPILDAIGGRLISLNMQLFRGMNLWYLGAFEPAQQILAAIPAADESLGMVSSWRRFSLAWLLADRSALDDARVLATELAEYGREHQFPAGRGPGPLGARRGAPPHGGPRGGRAPDLRRARDGGDPRAAGRPGDAGVDPPRPGPRPGGARGRRGGLRALHGDGRLRHVPPRLRPRRSTPRRSTRPARGTPRGPRSARRGRASWPSPSGSPLQRTGGASSRPCPRTRGPSRWRARGSASRRRTVSRRAPPNGWPARRALDSRPDTALRNVGLRRHCPRNQ